MIPGAVDLLGRATELHRQGTSLALATVVRSRRPASARPGDRALVLADGTLEGWVGGSCAQTTIQREALRALADGKPRLVRLTPDARAGSDEEEGVVSYPMTCHSGGSLEVYVEPFTPPPRLLVVGETPVAQGLAALAPPLGFAVMLQPDPGATPDVAQPHDAWVVVAAMGDRDDLAVEAALATGAPYVALVASPKRAAVVAEYLRGRGLGSDVLGRLKAPAGLDIGAATGPEIALSILAEIVQRRRALRAAAPTAASAPMLTARDPVCGMEVDVPTANWSSEYEEWTIYFCAPGCKQRFDREPTAYLTPAHVAA